MIFDELTAVLRAPAQPFESTSANNWGEVTDRFGENLPTDYMQFIDTFGSGSINDYIMVFNPFSANQNLNLFFQVFACLYNLRSLRSSSPEALPYPLFFEPGGLLPWGVSENGEIFTWLTNGGSGRWQVVVVGRDGGTEHFELSMAQFLGRLIKGEIQSKLIPAEFAPRKKGKFTSYGDQGRGALKKTRQFFWGLVIR